MIATCLMAAAYITTALHHTCKHVYSNRPDCLEFFSGPAEILCQFSQWGWSSMEPIDQLYGTDLTVETNRELVLSWIRKFRPRLVVVFFPYKLWSPITNVGYPTTQPKRRLRKRRLGERPFLEFCEHVCQTQLDSVGML